MNSHSAIMRSLENLIGSMLEVAGHATILSITQHADNLNVDAFGHEPHAAVAEQGMHATWVRAERLVIWTTVVVAPQTRWRAAQWRLIVVKNLRQCSGNKQRR